MYNILRPELSFVKQTLVVSVVSRRSRQHYQLRQLKVKLIKDEFCWSQKISSMEFLSEYWKKMSELSHTV